MCRILLARCSRSRRAPLPTLAASLLASSLLVIAGCSESTRIRTSPPGATVWINGSELGEAPVEFKARSWSVRPNAYRYRVELPGHLPEDGYVQPHLSISRIIAAAVSWCFTCSFRGFFVFDEETEIALSPEGSPAETSTPEDPAATRLRRLEALRDEGLITAEEYERYRADVLRDVVDPETDEKRGPSIPAPIRELIEPFLGAPGAPK
jgi:hypothetical protein